MARPHHRLRRDAELISRIPRRLGLVLAGVVTLLALTAPAASAHVVPTSSIQLVENDSTLTATVSIPVSDLDSAGVDVADQNSVDTYLLEHFAPTSDDGTAWGVAAGDYTLASAGNAATTGIYQQLTITFILTPAAGQSLESLDLGYDAVVEKVATHAIVVTARSGDDVTALGTIRRDIATNTVQPLHVDLGRVSRAGALTGMFALGMEHIKEGTDHQLFLLTLLLPAPLLAAGRRWGQAVSARTAVGRITRITLAFTLGHSVTLALGALGVPVPAQVVESLIAVSILVAAAHAVRPLFPGREALVAAAFGLIHGLAFSQTLQELDLAGRELALSLLGFNLGIEAMQLIVVALVLPPLLMLAHAGRYRGLRIVASVLTAVAALGWLLDRLGLGNPLATGADHLEAASLPLVVLLWLAAAAQALRSRVVRLSSAPRSLDLRENSPTEHEVRVSDSRARCSLAQEEP
ncbi:HupE/UreJ family protein [Kineosporia sp. J2-2]|uniref:HupE/UreJ family protein n=1 Tax=Kineosporia corallincola TaxID=2835133 RepID=A0ABS5TGK0_9ACTN|nr:HupE/UreJ family protein [Kineosporia corallincola]MBT0770223.1 HupE/UreJ family protein [Kineosporia corallincola]